MGKSLELPGFPLLWRRSACLSLPGPRIVCRLVLGQGSGPPKGLVKSRTHSACGRHGCFCLDERVPFSNSYKGTTWVSSRLRFPCQNRCRYRCTLQGARIALEVLCLSPCSLGPLRCRPTRCAAQRSWESSYCCVYTRSALLSSLGTPGTAATSVSLALMVSLPTSPAINGLRATVQ